jgi:ferredoxin
MLKTGHEVVRSGKKFGDPDVRIPIPEELETVPGVPINNREVDWYSREQPLETMNITEGAARHWYDNQTDEDEGRHEAAQKRRALIKPLEDAMHEMGDLEPTAEPTGEDVAELVKTKARELGFVEVGITRYDPRYAFISKKREVKYPHVVCLMYEENFAATQTIPSVENLNGRLITSPTNMQRSLDLGNYIRSLGYHAQIINTDFAVMIPMFVEAGLGQQGACGYLLSPHIGNRGRLQAIVTDANVSYDPPVDYGIHAFCQICQVCVNRCPGRALMRDKIWWRGVEKNKLAFQRCRPVMARYTGCGVCMKVCPVQKYGLKNVMEHYIATGQVLGKGTHDLEGYSLGDDYFAPGELPRLGAGFFGQMPRGTVKEYALKRFGAQVDANGGEVTEEILAELKANMGNVPGEDYVPMMSEDEV